MEQLITIAVAILGSGLLSTILNLVSHRSRDDRHAELLEAWVNEGKLLEDLEQRAGLENSALTERPRHIAQATAGRTYINTAIANRLVPKNNLEIVSYLGAGLLLAIIGLVAPVMGLVTIDVSAELTLVILGWVLVIVGIVAALLAGIWIFKGLKSETYRGIMRTEVQRTLNAETLPQESKNAYAERFNWIAGREPVFKRRHEIALPADLRHSFSYFMQHAYIGTALSDAAEVNSSRSHPASA